MMMSSGGGIVETADEIGWCEALRRWTAKIKGGGFLIIVILGDPVQVAYSRLGLDCQCWSVESPVGLEQ